MYNRTARARTTDPTAKRKTENARNHTGCTVHTGSVTRDAAPHRMTENEKKVVGGGARRGVVFRPKK